MNFVQMQAAVSGRLLDPSNTAVSLANVKDAINASIQYWKFTRFWFNTVRDTATLTAQDSVIPLSVPFLVPYDTDDGFAIEYSNLRYPMGKLQQSEYDGIWQANGYGLPRYYANLSGVYNCFPIPDQNYTIRRNYIRDYVDMVNDDDTNDFTVYAPRLIQYWALANLFRDFRQDGTMSDAFFNSSKDEYNNLLIMNNKSNATGGITISSFLTNSY